ncbi:hypothetical protein GQ457_11G026720 [Hibiscus cannabinus]
MSACLRAAWLAGGCCASGEFDEYVWQHLGGVEQFCSCWPCRAAVPIGGAVKHWPGLAWMIPGMLFLSPLSRGRGCLCAAFASFVATIGAWLWPPRERCLPLQHSCAPRSPRLDEGLPCALWPPRLCVGLVVVVSLLVNGHLALAVGATWPLSCFASFILAWCTSIVVVLWTSRFFSTYGVALILRPSHQPSCGKELAAVTHACSEQLLKAATVGNHPRCRPMLGLLGTAPTAWLVLSPQAPLVASVGSTLRGLLGSTSPCLRLALWLPVRPLGGAGLVARQCVRLATCLAEWVTLEWIGSMARPRLRFKTCSARYLLLAILCFEKSPKAAAVRNHPRCTRALFGCLRPLLGLFGAVPAARFVLPPQATLSATEGSTMRLASWLLVRPLCGFGLVARPCVRLASCLAEWGILVWFGSMARPSSDYFVSLFSANPLVVAPAFLEHITPSVTEDMNSGLLATFTAEEVIAAFRDINPRKSPGIDGLPSGFFRQHWDILGEDFVSLCLDLLRGQTDMASVNETVIVLIPKVDKPTSMRQLRPISLYTVIYKTVSKVLVNHSLLCRTLRAKYFPDGDLFSASAPARSSFAWKGLHRAMLHLRDGFFWTLGIDSQVRLFRDRWGGFSPITLAGDTIDREEIPLREVPISSDRADTLVWVTMIRVSTLFARAIFFFGGLLLPRPASAFVESPGKASHNSEGTVLTPQRPFARLASMAPSSPPIRLRWSAGLDLRPLLYLSAFALLLSVLWGLWRRRNTWVHERSLYPLHLVVEDAVLLCLDYASASASTQVSPPTAAAPPHWRPPPVGSVKVNVDGAFLPSVRLGAIGVIARDSSGAVLGGFAKPIPVQGPASTVEVAALFAGLEFAVANAWPSALIESDAAVLVNKLHRPTADLSLIGDMLAPSRALLAANVARFRVGFTPRLANIAAHTLASWACHNNDVITFSSVCPEFISRIVLDDLSSSF